MVARELYDFMQAELETDEHPIEAYVRPGRRDLEKHARKIVTGRV
jgi:hypothetical protein